MLNGIDENILHLLETFKAEVGYFEKKDEKNLDDETANAGRNNYTKYARGLFPTLQGQPWCDMFCDWRFVKTFGKAQTLRLIGPFSAYTPTSAKCFKDRKRWYSFPEVGDLIFFKNDVRIYHVGIVYKVSGDKVYTIEGNTSLGTEMIPDGGGVYYKEYAKHHSRITGYGRPDYSILKKEPRYFVGWNRDDWGWWYADTEKHILRAVGRTSTEGATTLTMKAMP